MRKEKKKKENCSTKIAVKPALQTRVEILANLQFNSLSLMLIYI